MNPLLPVLGIIAAFFALNAISASSAIKSLNFVFSSATVGLVGITPVVNIIIGIQNSSSTSFNVNSLTGLLYVNNILVGNINSFTRVTVLGNAQTSYPVQVSVSITGLSQDLIGIFSSGQLQANARLVGNVNVNNLQIPLDLSYKVL